MIAIHVNFIFWKNGGFGFARLWVMIIFVNFIRHFLALLRQSWSKLLGHLLSIKGFPAPLLQCCVLITRVGERAQCVLQHWSEGAGGGLWVVRNRATKLNVFYTISVHNMHSVDEIRTSVPTTFGHDCMSRPKPLSTKFIKNFIT